MIDTYRPQAEDTSVEADRYLDEWVGKLGLSEDLNQAIGEAGLA